MNDQPTRHFTVEETEDGWRIWVKVTTSIKRYQGWASPYSFASVEEAWAWVREQFGPDLDDAPAEAGDEP